jgi:hypothetical protein
MARYQGPWVSLMGSSMGGPTGPTRVLVKIVMAMMLEPTMYIDRSICHTQVDSSCQRGGVVTVHHQQEMLHVTDIHNTSGCI